MKKQKQIVIGIVCTAMGLTAPMASVYGAVTAGTGYVQSGPGVGLGPAGSGSTADGRSPDAADYAATGGTAQGAMTIRTDVPAGYVNSGALEVENPIVKTPDMYTYDFLVHDINALSARYGSKLRTQVIGTTPDGRSIYELSIGNQSAGTHILINASIHAREYITSNLVMKQLEYLLAYQDTGSFDGMPLRDWLSRVCIHFVPMINPDGVSISQFGIDGLKNQQYQNLVKKAYEDDTAAGRTNLPFERYTERWKANARGVNLNQNFDVDFANASGKATSASADSYRGPYAGSEPETQAMAKLIRGRHWKAILNYHSMGNILYWDVAGNPLREHCRDLANNLMVLTSYPLRAAGGGGGMKEYAQLSNDSAVSITLEIGSSEAPVNPAEMPTLWAQNKFVPLYTMKWAAEKGKEC